MLLLQTVGMQNTEEVQEVAVTEPIQADNQLVVPHYLVPQVEVQVVHHKTQEAATRKPAVRAGTYNLIRQEAAELVVQRAQTLTEVEAQQHLAQLERLVPVVVEAVELTEQVREVPEAQEELRAAVEEVVERLPT